MNNIVIKNLTVKYPFGAEAIANFSLDGKENAVMTIFGGAESGKTSLLKAIAGLVPVFSGSIVVNNVDITNFKCKDRKISLLYNEYGLFNNKTVQQNLLFPLKIRKEDKIKSLEIVTEVLQKFDISSIAQLKVKRLDNAQKIAVVFARSMVRHADIYLIDNIFANIIDSSARAQIFIKFLPIIQELSQKSCVIFATDNKFEAQSFGENITVLNYGITLQKGSFNEIMSNPLSLFVAKMFELDNLKIFHTQIIKDKEQVFINIENKQVILNEDRLINSIFIGKEVIVAVYSANKEEKIKIFDARSEQLIYFG